MTLSYRLWIFTLISIHVTNTIIRQNKPADFRLIVQSNNAILRFLPQKKDFGEGTEPPLEVSSFVPAFGFRFRLHLLTS